MYNNLRINRSLLKLDARRNYFQHRNPCLAFGVIYVAAQIVLQLLQDLFLPFLTVDVPVTALTSTDAMTRWYTNYVNNVLPGYVTKNNILIAVILGVIALMVLIPLRFYGYEIGMRLSSKRNVTLKDIGGWFLNGGRLLRSIGLTIAVYFKTFLWGVLFSAVPIGIIVAAALLSGTNAVLSSGLLVLGYMGTIAAALFTSAKLAKFSVAFYLFAETEDKKVFQSMREEREITKGRMWEVFVLYLSFILWRLLDSLVMGILSIYLMPYTDLTLSGWIYNVRAVNRGVSIDEVYPAEENEGNSEE